MSKKPTYEELEQRVKELEKQILKFEYYQLWHTYSQSPIPTLILSKGGKIVEYNDAMAQLTGYAHEEVPDIDAWMLKIYPDEGYRTEVIEISRKSSHREIDVKRDEFIITSKAEGRRHIAFSVFDILHDGAPTDLQVVQGEDITERVYMEEALRKAHDELENKVKNRTAELLKANQKLEEDINEHKRAEEAIIREKLLIDSIVDNTPAGIAFLDNDFVLRRCNHVYAELIRIYTPYTPEQALGMSYFDYAPGSRPQVEEWFQKVRETGQVDTRYGFKLALEQDGEEETSYWDTSVAPMLDAEGKINGILILTHDVTERKRAEHALRESETKLRALTVRLIEVEESERKQLARELHDRVGQNLTALNINLNIIRSQLSVQSTEKIGGRLGESMNLVEETTGHIRNVMAELRPEVLDDYGLMAAFNWCIERFTKRTGVAAEVCGEELTPRLTPSVETALFRIAQEAMNNVAKHARAGMVTITFEEVDGLARLTISDDGKGFDMTAIGKPGKESGWGLTTMLERAAGLGGELHVESEPGKGTRVRVEIRG